MSLLAESLVRSINRHGILQDGSRLLVAVSGGVDSMVLLHLLRELAPTRKWSLVVAHLNHQLRGRSSDADARFVRAQSQKLKLPCVVARQDVKAFSQRQKVSLEMAARELRHRFLAQTARRRKCAVIALAHHADDQAELVLLRLLRGSGSEGLGGMKVCAPSPADPAISLVRPLLEVRREQILAFAKEHAVRFREDRSNASTAHLRNRVRHALLPLLKKEYQPAIRSVLCRTAAILSAEADYVETVARHWMTQGEGILPLPHKGICRWDACQQAMMPGDGAFASLPLAVQRRVVQLQAVKLGLSLDFKTVEQLVAAPGQKINAPEGRHLIRQVNGRLSLVEAEGNHPRSVGEELEVSLRNAGSVEFAGLELCWQVEPLGASRRAGQVPHLERFDAELLGRSIRLRHWRAGDRFQPIGMLQCVKLQDLFTNLKVPRAERMRRVVAESESGGIFWVEGLRMGERFKLRPDTRKQLVWRWNCC